MNVRRIALNAGVLLLHIGGRARRGGIVGGLEVVLRPWSGAEIGEPMKVGLNETERDMRVEVMRRHDVEYGDSGHFVGMVESQAVCNSSPAIVSDHWERVEAEVFHHLDLI